MIFAKETKTLAYRANNMWHATDDFTVAYFKGY